jgi:hypothetical protein
MSVACNIDLIGVATEIISLTLDVRPKAMFAKKSQVPSFHAYYKVLLC